MTTGFICVDCGLRMPYEEQAYDESGTLDWCIDCDTERRDRDADEWWDILSREGLVLTEEDAGAYDSNDPKHPDYGNTLLEAYDD